MGLFFPLPLLSVPFGSFHLLLVENPLAPALKPNLPDKKNNPHHEKEKGTHISVKDRKLQAPWRYDKAFSARTGRILAKQGRACKGLGIRIDTLRRWLKCAGAPSPRQADRPSHETKRLRKPGNTHSRVTQKEGLCTKQIASYAFSDPIDTNLAPAALNLAVQRPA